MSSKIIELLPLIVGSFLFSLVIIYYQCIYEPDWNLIEKEDSLNLDVTDFLMNHAIMRFNDSLYLDDTELSNTTSSVFDLLENTPYHMYKGANSDTITVEFPDGRVLYLVYW